MSAALWFIPGKRGNSSLYLNLVEPFAVDSDDSTLRYECLGVDVLDQPEDDGRLAFLGQYEQHLHLVTRVETRSVNHRHAAVRIFIDVLSYLLVLVADDEELYRLAGTVDHLVEHKATDVKGDVSVDNFFPVLQREVAGRNDDEVADQHDASQRDVAILVDDGGDDIRSARTAVRRKGDADAASAERSSDDAGHEGLVVEQHQTLGQLLDDGQEKSQSEHGKDGLDAELPSQYPYGQQQQQHVDAEVSVLHRKTGSEIDDGRDARHASGGDVVGQQEYGPADAVHDHA